MNKKTRQYKKIPLSWMRKLGNTEFASLSNLLWMSVSRILKDVNFYPQYILDLQTINNELQALRPVPTSHQNTKMINQWHAQRKKLLSYIIVQSGLNARLTLYPDVNQEQYIFISKWLKGYGNRLYDLGIDKLTVVVHMMRQDYETIPEFRHAIDTCFLPMLNEMFELNEKIVDAQLSRTMDIANAKPQRGYTEVRREAVFEWQFFMMLLTNKIRDCEEDQETMVLLYNTLKQFMTEQHAMVKMRDTKRTNKKPVSQAVAKPKVEELMAPPLDNKPIEPTQAVAEQQRVEEYVEELVAERINEPIHKHESIMAHSSPQGGALAQQETAVATTLAPHSDKDTYDMAEAQSPHISIKLLKWDGERWFLI